MSRVATLLFTAAAAVCLSGCVGQPRHFTVETAASADPLIYAPGTEPGEALSILVPDVRMRCSQREVAFDVQRPGKANVRIGFLLTRRLIDQRNLGSEPVSVYARFSKSAYRELAEQMSPRLRAAAARWPQAKPAIHEALATALASDSCGLALEGGAGETSQAAQVTAQRILQGLPRAFSSVASYAYNHQVTGKGRGEANYENNGTSMDIHAGMRLRVENSLPIAPAGINGPPGHPSSLAAPVFVYFNPVSRAQVCDVDIVIKESDNTHMCGPNGIKDEQAVYLSPSVEMLRLGARQIHGLELDPTELQLTAVSSIIDLYERADRGAGIWKKWRLWFPNSRRVVASTPFTDGSAGSNDTKTILPVLIAAQDLATLDRLTQGAKAPPCKELPNELNTAWHCYFMYFRAAPVPEIAIRVNGDQRWVPVGTTLHDLVAPLQQADGIHAGSGQVDAGAGLLAERAAARLLGRVQIKRQFDGLAYPVRPDRLDNGLDASRFLRLQLLSGDEISW